MVLGILAAVLLLGLLGVLPIKLKTPHVLSGLPSAVILTEWGEREEELVWEQHNPTGRWEEGLWKTTLPFWMNAIGAVEVARMQGMPVVGCWLSGMGERGPTLVHVDLVNNKKYTLDVKKATGINEVKSMAANWTGEVCVGGLEGMGWFHNDSFTWTFYPVGSRGIPGPVTMLHFDREGKLWAGGYVYPGDDEAKPTEGWISVYDGKTWKTWTEWLLYPYGKRNKVPLPPVWDVAFKEEVPIIATDRGLAFYDSGEGEIHAIEPGRGPPVAGIEVADTPIVKIFYDEAGSPWLIGGDPVRGGRYLSYVSGSRTRRVSFAPTDNPRWIHFGLGRIWVVADQNIFLCNKSMYGEDVWKNGYIGGGPHGFLFDREGKVYFTGRLGLFRFDFETYGDMYFWIYEVEHVA